MRQPLLAILVSGLLLAGCGQAGQFAPTAPRQANQAAAAAAKPVTGPIAEALTRFSQQEGRKVTAKNVVMSEGRGAAELTVRLSATDRSLLVQLYRLHPKTVEASTFPEGLLARSTEHLTALHAFKRPGVPSLDPARLRTEIRTRVYRDGDENVLAYESWLVGDDYQLFGKYDLKGRILKVDMETWVN